jgi:hypothetical protein
MLFVKQAGHAINSHWPIRRRKSSHFFSTIDLTIMPSSFAMAMLMAVLATRKHVCAAKHTDVRAVGDGNTTCNRGQSRRQNWSSEETRLRQNAELRQDVCVCVCGRGGGGEEGRGGMGWGAEEGGERRSMHETSLLI